MEAQAAPRTFCAPGGFDHNWGVELCWRSPTGGSKSVFVEMNPQISANSVGTAGSRRGTKRRVKVIRPPSFSPLKLLANLSALAQYRDLLLTLSIHRVKVRYKQSM